MLDPSLNVRVSGHDRHEILKRETDCQTESISHTHLLDVALSLALADGCERDGVRPAQA